MYFCVLCNLENNNFMSNIIEQVESFLNYQNEVFGEALYVDSDYIAHKSSQVESKAKEEIKTQLISTEDNIKKEELKEDKLISNSSSSNYNENNDVSSELSNNANVEAPVKSMESPRDDIRTDSESWKSAKNMQELYDKICNCLECPLGKTRKNFVFGSGSINADILVIGEGPGAEEDEQGLPFVGRSGQLLTKILEAVNFDRSEVFIANIVKCRPPNNRRPEMAEVEQCEPYLLKQIELIKPKFILALGLTAVDTLFKTKHKMGDIRGKLMNYHGITTLATYHPAALLRNPNFKKDTWEDMKYLRQLYDEYKAKLNK